MPSRKLGSVLLQSLENVIIYIFSTIPKTLGTAFAVLAAFVIYRFQIDPAMGVVRKNSTLASERVRHRWYGTIGGC